MSSKNILCCGWSLESPKWGSFSEYPQMGFYEEVTNFFVKLSSVIIINESRHEKTRFLPMRKQGADQLCSNHAR